MKNKDQLILENIYISNILNEDNLLNPDELIDYVMWNANNHREFKILSDDDKNLFKKWISRDIKRKVANDVTPFRRYSKRMGGPEWYSTVKDGKVFKIPVKDIAEGEYLSKLETLVFNAVKYFTEIDAKERSKVMKITLQDAIQRYDEIFGKMPKENVDYKVVMNFEDGFKIVKLLTKLGYAYHGKGTSNCVSPEMCKKGHTIIYGLWNPNNKPKATIGFDTSTPNRFGEVAAFSTKYAPHLFDFIKTNNLTPAKVHIIGDDLFRNLPQYDEYLKSKGFDRSKPDED